MGRRYSLLPECFNYLLKCQQDNGAWAATASQIDGTFNSLAGLLALASRQRSDSLMLRSLAWRIEKSYSAIQGLLHDWVIGQSVHVGFEILVPNFLRQLESFNLHFEFPGRSTLIQLDNQRLKI